MIPFNPTRPAGLLVLALTAVTLLGGCVPLMMAGAGAGVVAAQDRRTASALWNDQQLESRVAERVAARFGTASHVNITSFNRTVLLSGEVPDQATRSEVERLARETPDVRSVQNELAIMLPSSLSARASDSTLTALVKTRLLDNPQVSTIHIKVVSERNQVFLMGLVTRQEAKAAATVASVTPGVEKVFTVFEYLD